MLTCAKLSGEVFKMLLSSVYIVNLFTTNLTVKSYKLRRLSSKNNVTKQDVFSRKPAQNYEQKQKVRDAMLHVYMYLNGQLSTPIGASC